MDKKKLLFFITIGVLVVAFAVSAFLVVDYIMEGKREAEMYEQLAQQATANLPTTPATSPTQPAETTAPQETTPAYTGPIYDPTEILPEMKTYYEANDHTVGYIEIPGTKVDYPVMQTPDDPDFYLKRNFERNASERGTLFAWQEANIEEPSDNITIFGHNMKDGSMFASLLSYQNEEYWKQNPVIFFDTLHERHTYKIFAVFKTSANIGEGFSYHKFVNAATKEEYEAFVNTCKELSFYDTGITPVYVDENTKDKMICLSTCEYTLANGRFVVCAVRWT